MSGIKKLISVLATFVLCILSAIGSIRAEENPCLALPNGTGFLNDYRSCGAYFSCVNFTPFEVNCPNGLYFDFGRLKCDIPSRVNCKVCPQAGIRAVPDARSCQRWTLCVNGHEMPQKCAPGTAFNNSIGTCDLAENVSCPLDTCAALDSGIGIAPSPEDCETYYYCYNSAVLQRSRCQTGLSFDTVTGRCVLSNDAACFPGTTARGIRRN